MNNQFNNCNNTNGESRHCQVVLIDGRKLDFLIQPKLSSADLLDLVASHFNLKEKEYFGLAFIDSTGHRNWLQSDKKVLDHEFSKKPGQLVFHFAIRFFIENIAYLKEKITVELFYIQAKLSIIKNELETTSDKVFELTALVLQAQFGDYLNEDTTRICLKKAQILPQKLIDQSSSMSFCEEKVVSYYKKLNGLTRGQAIVNYMTVVEHLPNYGIHYYEVKDKSNTSWYLGISYKGIAVYDYNDRIVPKKIFHWRHLENLYYRERKFSIEVHETKSIQISPTSGTEFDVCSNTNMRSSNAQSSYRHSQEIALLNAAECAANNLQNLSNVNNNSRRSQSVSTSILNGHSSSTHHNHHHPLQQQQQQQQAQNQVKVHAWFASQPSLCKSIWLMAVAQHQFYLDRKQCKANMYQFKSLNDLAIELSTSTLSLSGGSLNSDTGSGSLNLNLSRANSLSSQELLEQSRLAKQEMWLLYKARKENLEKLLAKKKEELRETCVREAEITGRLGKEYPLEKGEEAPVIKRKIAASYQYNRMHQPQQQQQQQQQNQHHSQINELTLEFEIQQKITNAALILASDPSAIKQIRKQRREFYEKAREKLSKMEAKLNALKVDRFNLLSKSLKKDFNGQCNKFCDDFVDLNTPKVITHSIGHKSTPTSPVMMINRKESYRRAQQQKLSIEKSNENNNLNQIPVQIQAQRQKTPILLNKLNKDSNDYDAHSYMNMIYGSTTGLSLNTSQDTSQKTSPQVIPDNITFRNRGALHGQKSTSTLKTPVHTSNSQVVMLAHANGNNSLKKNTTSDSNVKLLADHNFYHVTNKSDSNHKKMNDEKNEEIFRNILFNHHNNHEISDYTYKYDGGKYRGAQHGHNNNSNSSLLMINTNDTLNTTQSTPTTPLYESIYSNQKSTHSSPQTYSSLNMHNNNNNNNYSHRLNHSQNSSSQNYSLNLSIHTAEEFGKEMLAWLQNENKNASTSSGASSTAPPNTSATLV